MLNTVIMYTKEWVGGTRKGPQTEPSGFIVTSLLTNWPLLSVSHEGARLHGEWSGHVSPNGPALVVR
jgi:hypothetical protein